MMFGTLSFRLWKEILYEDDEGDPNGSVQQEGSRIEIVYENGNVISVKILTRLARRSVSVMAHPRWLEAENGDFFAQGLEFHRG